MSDFDWIEQHDINPWLEYDTILFDIEPTQEDVTKYINMALQTLEFGNRDVWEGSVSSDSEYLIDLFREWGSSYIRMTEFDDLLQGYDVDYLRDNNVIKYSELVGNQLMESEDEWDWAREITPWVSFHQAEKYESYGIKKNDLLLQALRDCEDSQRMYHDSVSVVVLEKDELRHLDVHCGSGNEDRVLSLFLKFYGQNSEYLGRFWVTEDMVTLHQLYDNLKESDEWDWAREIPTIDLSEGVYYIDLEGLTPNERCDVQQVLLDAGCLWIDGNNLKSFNYEYIAYTVYDGILYTSVTDYKTWSRREIDHNYIGGKSLLNNGINESEDELNWIRETPLNPWYDYDSIDFDIEPTDEDVNHYIELALQTREISNRDAWGSGRKSDISAIKDYARDGDCQLVINQWGEMTFGPKRFVETNKRIKYSELKQNTITESEDGLEWIINTNPEDVDVITFFQEGKCYYMGKLTNKDIGCVYFEEHELKMSASTYEDGRGLLKFGTYWYSPKFIEEMLKEKNITLYDLETKENISNLMESDEMDWIINTEIPIEPGTMYRSSDEQTLREILQLIEDKFPKAKWMSGAKPTEFFPSLDDYAGRRRASKPTIVLQDDYMMYFSMDDRLGGDELNYQLIEL